jgi:hypothetical protein
MPIVHLQLNDCGSQKIRRSPMQFEVCGLLRGLTFTGSNSDLSSSRRTAGQYKHLDSDPQKEAQPGKKAKHLMSDPECTSLNSLIESQSGYDVNSAATRTWGRDQFLCGDDRTFS